MKYQFPEEYGQECILVPVDKSLAPMISGVLMRFLARSVWETDRDYEKGYNAFAELLYMLANDCLTELISIQNATYRLLDSALNGTVYTSVPDPVSPGVKPNIVNPAIPDVPTSNVARPGVRSRIERLVRLTDHIATGRSLSGDGVGDPDTNIDVAKGLERKIGELQGQLNAGWFGIGGKDATLADVVTALRIGSDAQKDSVLDVISQISGVGSSAANIFDAVKDLFVQTVDLGAEGAQVGVLIASSLASAAIAAQQQINNQQTLERLDQLLFALRGAQQPVDNVLLALRGQENADDQRNVIDAARNGPIALNSMVYDGIIPAVDGIEQLLTGISTKLD